jgi:hypothetical protein
VGEDCILEGGGGSQGTMGADVFGAEVSTPDEFATLAITATQNVLVCFEMFVASIMHHVVFPASHFRYRDMKADENVKLSEKVKHGLEVMFDWRDAADEVKRFWWTIPGAVGQVGAGVSM